MRSKVHRRQRNKLVIRWALVASFNQGKEKRIPIPVPPPLFFLKAMQWGKLAGANVFVFFVL